MNHLVFIFGDQLTQTISSLKGFNKKHDHILMAEVIEEATYVKHHKKKLVFVFSAMRHFAAKLKQQGFSVHYVELDSQPCHSNFTQIIQSFIAKHQPQKLIITEPSEYRVLEQAKLWQQALGLPVDIREDERFLCSRSEFKAWSKDKKKLLMEYFYRYMRKKLDVLMDGDQPIAGQWNFDASNRKKLPKKMVPSKPLQFEPDDVTRQIMHMVNDKFSEHFGHIKPFFYAVTHESALEILNDFISHRLIHFGDYQDAMTESSPWIFHAVIGLYLNIGLLTPLECINKAIHAYEHDNVPINAVEGFIRQIIGWREFVRGIYWQNMPEYKDLNALLAHKNLPSFFWDGKTKLNCLKHCIQDTQNNAYAHHIQRLMILGNFCLLLGVDPQLVNEWYLIVYADAYEWVELPNVTGMAIFADGGILGSKPYAASGSYINKMSDYCKECTYDIKNTVEKNACPFNYLYWAFIDKHRDILEKNPRMKLIYSILNKMSDNKLKNIRSNADLLTQQIGANKR